MYVSVLVRVSACLRVRVGLRVPRLLCYLLVYVLHDSTALPRDQKQRRVAASISNSRPLMGSRMRKKMNYLFTLQNTPCLKKTAQTYFLSELCQISSDGENFWLKDSREDTLF